MKEPVSGRGLAQYSRRSILAVAIFASYAIVGCTIDRGEPQRVDGLAEAERQVIPAEAQQPQHRTGEADAAVPAPEAQIGQAGAEEDARIDMTRAKLLQIENALERFNLRFGRYPSEVEGLQVLVTGPDEEVDDFGRPFEPLLRGGISALRDGWGNPVNYALADEDGRWRAYVWSNGPDGNNDNRGGDDILPHPRPRPW